MKKQGFTLIELLVVISIIALLIGILLPALSAARRTARQMQSNTQVRGVHQSMFAYSQSNRDFLPGLTGRAQVEEADAIASNGIVDGLSRATVEYRMAEMLTNDFFTGEYAISPVETKTLWTDENAALPAGDVTQDNFSYALLRVHDQATGVGPNTAANQGRRVTAWKGDLDTETILITDRARLDTASGEIYSIHTSPPTGATPVSDWRGSVAWADNHVTFETTDRLDAKYASGSLVNDDTLFSVVGGTYLAGGTATNVTNANANQGDANAVMDAFGEGQTLTADDAIREQI